MKGDRVGGLGGWLLARPNNRKVGREAHCLMK